jgi:copper chaperone
MVKLNVEGMTCEHCQAAVKRALESVPESGEVIVDLEQGAATIAGKPDINALIAAVQEEGYEASSRS